MQLTKTRTNLPIYEVSDSTKFACFDYAKTDLNPTYKIGQIVAKETEDDIEVGVILNTYTHGDIRTDQFGVECDTNLRPATLEEINTHRPNITAIEQTPWTYFTMTKPTSYTNKKFQRVYKNELVIGRTLNPDKLKEDTKRNNANFSYQTKISFTSKKLKPYIEGQLYAPIY